MGEGQDKLQSSSMRRRSWIYNLILLAVSATIAAVALEYGARAIVSSRLRELDELATFFVSDPILGFTGR